MQLSTSGNTMSLALSMPEKDFEQFARGMHADHKPADTKPAEKL
jgi:hypothetical protein